MIRFNQPYIRYISILAILGLVFKYIWTFIGTADIFPYWTTDDALDAISYSLAHTGIYGFLSSPFQAPAHTLRHDAFYNYGPWYFYLGAVLIKIFGYSLSLFRGISVGLMVSAMGIFYLFCKRNLSFPKTAFAVFSFLVVDLLIRRHILIARPDIMGAFFIFIAILSFLSLVKNLKPIYLYSSIFFSSLAALSHPFNGYLAITIAITSFLYFMTSTYQRHQTSLLQYAKIISLCILSGATPIYSFFASFDFRYQEYFTFLKQYQQFVSNLEQRSGSDLIIAHLTLAFEYLLGKSMTLWLSVLALLVGLTIIFGFKNHTPNRMQLLLLSFIFFLNGLTLQFYKWPSSYYSTGMQLVFFCLIGLTVINLLSLLNLKFQKLSTLVLHGALTILCCGYLYRYPELSKVRTDGTPISQLRQKILDEMPPNSMAFGDLMFGSFFPEVQLLQFSEGLNLFIHLDKTQKLKLKPEYLIWGINEESAIRPLVFGPSRDLNQWLFGAWYWFEEEYQVQKIFYGYPYGVIRVYAQKGIKGSEPEIEFYLDQTHLWVRNQKESQELNFKQIYDAKISQGYNLAQPNQSFEVVTNSKYYLVKVEWDTHVANTNIAVCLSPEKIAGQTDPYFPLGFDCQYTQTDRRSAYLVASTKNPTHFLTLFNQGPDQSVTIKSVTGYEIPERNYYTHELIKYSKLIEETQKK